VRELRLVRVALLAALVRALPALLLARALVRGRALLRVLLARVLVRGRALLRAPVLRLLGLALVAMVLQLLTCRRVWI